MKMIEGLHFQAYIGEHMNRKTRARKMFCISCSLVCFLKARFFAHVYWKKMNCDVEWFDGDL